MAQRFFGQEIRVEVEGEVRQPVSFRLEGNEYVFGEIMAVWADYGFGSNPPARKRWWMRRYRNCYRVRTMGGEVFEIYYDRGVSMRNPKYRKWYVSRQLDDPDGKDIAARRGDAA